jgi:hypothetical protein
MGVDVGWQGDESVICPSISAIRLRVDPEDLFNRILLEYRLQRIFIDAGGLGGSRLAF